MRISGVMLNNTAKSKGNRGQLNGKSVSGNYIIKSPEKNGKTLKELGLTPRESSESQMIAELDVDDFEKLKKGKLSIKQALKNVLIRRTQLQEKEALKKSNNNGYNITKSQDVISCDALITDVPYGILNQNWEPDNIEDFTRRWLVKWDKSDADFIVSFFSQEYIWEGRQWLDELLTNYKFQQLLIWNYRNNRKIQSHWGFKRSWEPIFFYRRKDSKKKITINSSQWGGQWHMFDSHNAPIPLTTFKGVDMKQHPAQKPLSTMLWLVNVTTKIGDLVVDPFCGSGTTGIACCQLNRRFHGIEINPDYRKMAKRRIAMYGKVNTDN